MSVAEHSIAGAEARGHGFLASSVGRKVVMALTGIILFGFVTVHMIGNTQAYLGAEGFNAYAKFLHTMLHGAGIWIFRAVLVAAAGLHACAATSLTLDNNATSLNWLLGFSSSEQPVRRAAESSATPKIYFFIII